MKKKHKLNPQELDFIREREVGLSETINTLRELNKFKEGDYLIAFYNHRGFSDTSSQQVTNSYGAPKKFTVVHVDICGVPYMKELNNKGNPIGQLICPVKVDGGYSIVKVAEYRFEIDPDYTDSIIMQDEANYDASIMHREKSDLFKEITEHNKKIKVKVKDQTILIPFLKTLKVGDILWRSSKNFITITKMDPLPLNKKGLLTPQDFGEATASNGKIVKLNAWYFIYSAIYTDRPRSYNEMKDLK